MSNSLPYALLLLATDPAPVATAPSPAPLNLPHSTEMSAYCDCLDIEDYGLPPEAVTAMYAPKAGKP